jgi:hypothetical protein
VDPGLGFMTCADVLFIRNLGLTKTDRSLWVFGWRPGSIIAGNSSEALLTLGNVFARNARRSSEAAMRHC